MITNKKLKYYTILFFSVIIIFSIFLPNLNINAASDETIKRIYDYTNELTDQQENALEDLSEEYYQDTGYHFLVVITNTREEYFYKPSNSLEQDYEEYSKAFYNDFLDTYGKTNKDCAILTLDISSNRYADVSGQGVLEKKLDSNRCTLVYEHILDSLSSNNWYDGATEYMKYTAKYIQYREGVNPNNIIYNIWFQLIVAIFIGALITGMLIYHSGGKMTVTNKTYLNQNKSKIVNQYDHYLRTSTRRTKRANSNSNGGSGGSRSSGGGSHGGGHF